VIERRHRRRGTRGLAAALAVFGWGGAAACGSSETASDAPDETAGVTRSLDLVFRREAEDRILVVEHETQRVLRRLEAGEGGFLRGALRPLERERRRHEVELDRPFTLALYDDGRLLLRDTPTGMTLDVAAFGATSREQFLTLFEGEGSSDTIDPTDPPAPNRPMEDRP
jgi:putative photosynthetic complex assembly protein